MNEVWSCRYFQKLALTLRDTESPDFSTLAVGSGWLLFTTTFEKMDRMPFFLTLCQQEPSWVMTTMAGGKQISKSLKSTTLIGALVVVIVGYSVLIPLKIWQLSPAHHSWTFVLIVPLLGAYMISGIVVIPIVGNRLDIAPLSLKSVLLHWTYIGLMLVVMAIVVAVN